MKAMRILIIFKDGLEKILTSEGLWDGEESLSNVAEITAMRPGTGEAVKVYMDLNARKKYLVYREDSRVN